MAVNVCFDCTHFSACALWNVGSITNMKACALFKDAYKEDQFVADIIGKTTAEKVCILKIG